MFLKITALTANVRLSENLGETALSLNDLRDVNFSFVKSYFITEIIVCQELIMRTDRVPHYAVSAVWQTLYNCCMSCQIYIPLHLAQ